MNKTRGTETLDSLIIKKLKNISLVSSDPNPSVDAHTETINVNLHQCAISHNIIEMTTSFLIPENNRLSIENNSDDLINSTLLNEEDPSLSSANLWFSNFKHVDINLKESIIVNSRENEKTNICCSTNALKYSSLWEIK